MNLIKYIPIFILLFGVVIVSAKKSDYTFPLFGRLIVVDVGHGGNGYPQKENFCKI